MYFLCAVYILSFRSRLGLGLTGLGSEQDLRLDSNGETTANGLGLADLYYNSRPEHASDRSAAATWSYQPPPPPVITEQPKPSSTPQHFQPYERGYPKTLESLAEKVRFMLSLQTNSYFRMERYRRQTLSLYIIHLNICAFLIILFHCLFIFYLDFALWIYKHILSLVIFSSTLLHGFFVSSYIV
jgi:hypothetical protein